MTKSQKALEIYKRLKKYYPKATTALNHTNAFELLVATIMSAQTTDKLVNTITPALFKKYPTSKEFTQAPLEEIDAMISKVNFHNNKSKNIKATAQILTEKYDGNVPDSMDELLGLPGVARKTANVVLGNWYHKAEGVVCDTHVIRLSQRLGLTEYNDPKRIEIDLMKILPKEYWIDFANMLVLYGREFCPARAHKCPDCPLGDLCADL